MSGQNVALVRRWFAEVWNQGRLDTIQELMAADAVGIGQGGADVVIRGPQQFRAFVEKLRGAFPDIHVTVEDAFEAGDKVAARWSATMTHRGGQLGIAASGKEVRITGISIVRIADGQIVQGWDNWDQLTMMREIGAIGEPRVSLPAAALEMRKQFATYADAITAFATAQLIGYLLLLTHGDCFTLNVITAIWWAAPIGAAVNLFYVRLVFLCHRAARKLPDQPVGNASAVHSIERLRYIILAADVFFTLVVPFAIRYGWSTSHFFIDCKAACTHL